MSGRRLLTAWVVLLGAVCSSASNAGAGPAAGAPSPRPSARAGAAATAAAAYPAPGSTTALPATGITFRGIDPAQAAAVQVTGSVSGAHAVTLSRHRDGHGATLQPRVPFLAGEQVTVQGIDIAGASGNRFSFTVATPGRPRDLQQLRSGLRLDQSGGAPPSPARSTRSAVGPPYRTRPDLQMPHLTLLSAANGTAPGYIVTNPGTDTSAGIALLDDRLEPVWFHGTTFPIVAGDLEKARYAGQDVLVYFEGVAPYGPGSYRGAWTMLDSTYRTIATIGARNGMQPDIHDIEITPEGNAYILIFNPVVRDLRSLGGSATATVLELAIQEINIASGDLLFEWHSLDHIPVSDGQFGVVAADPVDYMHGNSVVVDTDGNLLVSARNISTVFKIRRSNGDVIWRLGGNRNQFTFSPAGEPGPSAQHDAYRLGPGVISIFDNGLGRNSSRGVRYLVDEQALTATRIKEQRHSPNIFAFAQGSYRNLVNGNDVIAWGFAGVVTEYQPDGVTKALEFYDPDGIYRSTRATWTGRPASLPAVVAERRTGHDTVFVSWNGATDVASWEVLGGRSRSSLASVARVPRDGFETAINVPSSSYIAVRGLAANGSVLGTSAVTPVGPWFSERSTLQATGSYRPFTGDFAGGAGDDVLFYGPGTTRDYLWTSTADGTFVAAPTPAVNGDYRPLVGDFVGDFHDDVLWWRRGSTRAYLWRSDGNGGFADVAIGVPATSVASVLRHRAGKAEVLWYNPGRPRDLISGYRWDGGGEPTGVRRSINVNGTYRPVIGDFDGNGWADIVWYGAGPTVDYYWRLYGNTGASSTGQIESTVPINGSYSPLVGRFSLAHDRRDDIVWYGRGSAPDFLWEGTTGPAFDQTTHTNSATGDPLLLHGTLDHLYLRTAGTQGTIWVPNAHPDLIRGSGNTALGSEYLPVVGDFGGTGRSGILWYAPGTQSERLFSPALG